MFKKAFKRSLSFILGMTTSSIITGICMGMEVEKIILLVLPFACGAFFVNLYFVKREDKDGKN